jgi:hypothetical protein
MSTAASDQAKVEPLLPLAITREIKESAVHVYGFILAVANGEIQPDEWDDIHLRIQKGASREVAADYLRQLAVGDRQQVRPFFARLDNIGSQLQELVGKLKDAVEQKSDQQAKIKESGEQLGLICEKLKSEREAVGSIDDCEPGVIAAAWSRMNTLIEEADNVCRTFSHDGLLCDRLQTSWYGLGLFPRGAADSFSLPWRVLRESALVSVCAQVATTNNAERTLISADGLFGARAFVGLMERSGVEAVQAYSSDGDIGIPDKTLQTKLDALRTSMVVVANAVVQAAEQSVQAPATVAGPDKTGAPTSTAVPANAEVEASGRPTGAVVPALKPVESEPSASANPPAAVRAAEPAPEAKAPVGKPGRTESPASSDAQGAEALEPNQVITGKKNQKSKEAKKDEFADSSPVVVNPIPQPYQVTIDEKWEVKVNGQKPASGSLERFLLVLAYFHNTTDDPHYFNKSNFIELYHSPESDAQKVFDGLWKQVVKAWNLAQIQTVAKMHRIEGFKFPGVDAEKLNRFLKQRATVFRKRNRVTAKQSPQTST